MLKTPKSFVVITEPKSGHIIQFYNQDGSILVDFPAHVLAPAQMASAEKYFSRLQFEMQNYELKDPKTNKSQIGKSWAAVFPPENVSTTVEIALDAIGQIFGISASERLKIEKGRSE